MSTLPQARPRFGLPRLSWPVLIAGGLLIAVIATVLFRFAATSTTDPLANLTLAPVTRGDLQLTVSATGSVEPNQTAELSLTSWSSARGVGNSWANGCRWRSVVTA